MGHSTGVTPNCWRCVPSLELPLRVRVGHHVEYAEHFGCIATRSIEWSARRDAPEDAPPSSTVAGGRELHTKALISDATYAELTSVFNPAQLIELVMTVGQYTMLSMVANSFEVTMEPGLEPLPR